MCHSDRSVISILIPCALVLGVGVIAGCYWWTWANGDLRPGETYPYISDLGNKTPQQYLFAIGFWVLALFFGTVSIFRFFQLRWAIAKEVRVVPCCCVGWLGMNYVMLIVALIGFLSMGFLASFNNLDYNTVHNVFAVSCFGLLFAYQVLHTALAFEVREFRKYRQERCKANGKDIAMHVNKNGFYEAAPLGLLAYYVIINCMSGAALVIGSFHYLGFDDAGNPAIAESVLVFSTIVYYAPWFWELENFTMKKLMARTGHRYDALTSESGDAPETF